MTRLLSRSRLLMSACVGIPVGAVATLTGAAAAPGTAGATAFGCIAAPGGLGALQCLTIVGNASRATWVGEEYEYGVGGHNACEYNANWRGDTWNNGWTTWYGNYVSGCSFDVAWEGLTNPGSGYMRRTTEFYGRWKSTTTQTKWTGWAAELIEN